MRLGVALGFGVLLGGCRTRAAAVPAPGLETSLSGKQPADSPETLSLEKLGAEFRLLRSAPGHFGDGGGPWNDAVDGSGGRKRALMDALRARLSGASRTEVFATMGDPDEIAHPGAETWAVALHGARISPEGSELLVYHWRGRHDFLYFVVRAGRVVHAGWWMAGE